MITREYDIYLPTAERSGASIDPRHVNALRSELRERFGGVTHFTHENQGEWKVGKTVLQDTITVLRVLAADEEATRRYFTELKARLERDLQQDAVLIVTRLVEIVGARQVG